MKFALIGYPVKHSLSPKLYKKIIGPEITYDLLNIPLGNDLPSLTELAQIYDGINITSPYKNIYNDKVEFEAEDFSKIGFINAISFVNGRFIGTNTDYMAVDSIMSRFHEKYIKLKILLLGNGAMAKLTHMIASKLNIPVIGLSRSLGNNMQDLDLRSFSNNDDQILVINSCSREYIFNGQVDPSFLFWDYNYSYMPDEKALSLSVKDYTDGQELLSLQAQFAVDFWKRTNPKLK